MRSQLAVVGASQLCWENTWGLYLVVRLQPLLENCASSPLEMWEPGGGLAVGMEEQGAPFKDFLKQSDSFKLGDTCWRWCTLDCTCNYL